MKQWNIVSLLNHFVHHRTGTTKSVYKLLVQGPQKCGAYTICNLCYWYGIILDAKLLYNFLSASVVDIINYNASHAIHRPINHLTHVYIFWRFKHVYFGHIFQGPWENMYKRGFNVMKFKRYKQKPDTHLFTQLFNLNTVSTTASSPTLVTTIMTSNTVQCNWD